MAMFRTGVKILRELSPKKGHCILPIRSISEERHLVLRKPACPTNSIPPQNCIERSMSWVSLSSKKIDESNPNPGLALNAQSPSTPISGKPKVAGLQHYYYRPRGKNSSVKIIKDGYITCCEGTNPPSQGPPFAPDQDRRVRRNSKRPPFDRKELTMSSNTAHYKPPYTEYKMTVDTRQPKMQGHFLKIYDVNEITVRSDSAAAHPNYTEHRRIGQTPSGKCLRSSKPIPDEVRGAKRMEIPTDQSVYSYVNQQMSSFSKIPTLLESHAPYRNISTSQGGKLNPEVQEMKKSTQDVKSYVENPVCNMQEFTPEKPINKNNFGYNGRIPSPSYSEMKKAELENGGKTKPIFPLHNFGAMSNDAVLSQKPFGISGKSLKEICSEGIVRNNFNGNDMKSHEVSNNPQFPIPNMPLTDVQCFADETKSFSDTVSAMSKLNTAVKEQKTHPLKKFEDNFSYEHKMKAENIAREIKANASKLKDSNCASNILKSEEASVSGKSRNLKMVQFKRDGREPSMSQKDCSKYEEHEQKEYSTVKEKHEPVYQQRGNFKEWQENATQRGNYEKAEDHNVESYSMNKAETANAQKGNMSKGNDVEMEDVITKKSLPQKQKASSLFASEEKSMKTVSKYSKDSLLQKNIPTTNVSHFLNIESVYDKHKKFQNPFTEAIAEDTTPDLLPNSRLMETENVITSEKLAKSSDKNTTGYFKQNKMNAEQSDKSLNSSHGGSKQRVIKWSPAKTGAKFSPSPSAQFGTRNYSVLANNAKMYRDKIKGSSVQSCNMGTKHPKLGDLSAKNLPDKVPCGTKKLEQDFCKEKTCKRVCVPGCLIPRQIECENEPATPPPCVKVEAPHPSFSECLKCPPLPPYSKLTECHVEKPRGYYKEYKGDTGDACHPPVVVGVCPVRNAFKRVKRARGEYNVNCDKPPKYPCEVESTFPPSRTKGRDGAAPMKCQSNHSTSGSTLNKISPVQVRFYSSGKLNSPLVKSNKNEADKLDSQPSTSGVLQNRCIHTPVSLISSTTTQFNPASILKITGSTQNLSTCDSCGDSKKYGHDIPLRYKYGDFFPTSSYRKGFMPHPSKNKRSVEMPGCNSSTSTPKTCSMRTNTGPSLCGGRKTPHVPYYPTSPYRPTSSCPPSNSDCNPSCIKPHPRKDDSCKPPKDNCTNNAPCQRPHCPTPAIKRPCSCSPQDAHGKPLQMRCYSGTSFSGNNSKASSILKRHYSDIVPSVAQKKIKLTPPLLNEASSNILIFPTLERLKQNVRENEPNNTLDSVKQAEVFSNAFSVKDIKFPSYMVNDVKCADEGCDTCKKPKCDRCEKKQCPRPHYKQCPKPPPKRRMCENIPKCPPKPCQKTNRDKPCCPDKMCKPVEVENAQVKMASGENVTANSKEISRSTTLQGLLNSFKSFMSLFITKTSTKDSPTAVFKKTEDNVESKTVEAESQSQEGRQHTKSESNTTGPHNHMALKSGRDLNGGVLSKPIAAEYYHPLNKGPQENSFSNMNSLKCKSY